MISVQKAIEAYASVYVVAVLCVLLVSSWLSWHWHATKGALFFAVGCLVFFGGFLSLLLRLVTWTLAATLLCGLPSLAGLAGGVCTLRNIWRRRRGTS